uniref:Uncharacterized protein n=1 Tax=Pseudictyota dubia TaxID=2749911 RepID=A0A7R9VL11_9STRA|mmetsp:Transcript_16475/g.31037  ORF Transcript_16475/g.31037 Transcript_16475/m.31037 type:complete len:260 (+) Transcript_16475:128-907(+)
MCIRPPRPTKLFNKPSQPKKPKVFLDDLIRSRNWDAVRKAVEASNSRFHSGSSKTACSRRCSSSALSLAVSLDPPSDVVVSLLRLDPAAASHPDRSGRLPLHVACSTGASVDAVCLLLRATSPPPADADDRSASEGSNQGAALCADADGRTPLHHAVEYASGNYYSDTLEVIAVLCAACPGAAFVKDRWGETPCDVAAQMEEASVLDHDLKMIEESRAVRRIVWQTVMMPWKRISKIGRRAEMRVIGYDDKMEMKIEAV